MEVSSRHKFLRVQLEKQSMMAKPTAFFNAATTNTQSMALMDFIFGIALVMKMQVLGKLILQ